MSRGWSRTGRDQLSRAVLGASAGLGRSRAGAGGDTDRWFVDDLRTDIGPKVMLAVVGKD